MSQKPSMSLSLNHESALMATTAEVASLPLTVSISTDHGLPRETSSVDQAGLELTEIHLPLLPKC